MHICAINLTYSASSASYCMLIYLCFLWYNCVFFVDFLFSFYFNLLAHFTERLWHIELEQATDQSATQKKINAPELSYSDGASADH